MNHVTRWMEEERLKIAIPPRKAPKVYIRFGKFSRGQRSLNFATGQTESGLSVYNARLEADSTVSLIADDWSMIGGLTASVCAGLLAGRLAFVVTGRESGQGSDGEPVLTGVRLLPYAIRPDSMPAGIRQGAVHGLK